MDGLREAAGSCDDEGVSGVREGGMAGAWKVIPLGEGGGVVWESPDPGQVHAVHPSLAVLQSGRMVVALDQVGPGVKGLPGVKGQGVGRNRYVQGQILTSGDGGATWERKERYPFSEATLFVEGGVLYALGHAGAVQIMKSANGGETWGKPVELLQPAEGEIADGPANAWIGGGAAYATFMVQRDRSYRGDPASVLAPVVLRAEAGAPLTNPRSWRRSDPVPAFRDLVPHDELAYFGAPFYDVPQARQGERVGRGGAWANRLGWREAHILQAPPRGHAWSDPRGRTLHLVARAHTHRGDLAAFARITLDDQGAMSLSLQDTPAGKPWAFIPLPGGSRRFTLFHDPPSERFWLVSHQPRHLLSPPGRHLPGERRGPLQLSFSQNLVDWSFAGLIDIASQDRSVAQDPTAAPRGDDLVVVSRSHSYGKTDNDRQESITCRIIPRFRDLVY
jgi:hypothetical protein